MILLEKRKVDRLLKLLEEKHHAILDKWLVKADLSMEDPYYSEVINNGGTTILLIREYLLNPDIETIKKLTSKIAKERIDANVNISQFTYNINIGRSIVTEIIKESKIDENEKIDYILVVDNFFNHYLYEAIKEYTELKDSIIQKKSQFIQEMHTDRLSILGQIAASFAHEFRNPLTSIKGFINLIERNVKHLSETDLYFSIINREMASLEEKVSQFLYLSKSKGLDDRMDQLDLSLLIKEVLQFMYPRIVEENIIVNEKLQNELIVQCVKDQLKQVLLNIISNAADALSNTNGERIIGIEAEKNNQYIILKISNNGEQIPDHLLEDIFEPFVSTKELGTGLGLSVCKQIIEKHNGTIKVETNESTTEFIIQLPFI